ncbi:MAG TPA: hypothetical protein VNK46_05045 [Nitrospiraceae bacterium]|jgi:hypothetical protein|nr:hypothetical protein [Nitrospiraceae bacterium]
MRRQSTPIERAVEDNWGPDRLTASLRERIQEVIITLVAPWWRENWPKS